MDYLSYKRVFKHGNNFCWEKLKKESCKAKWWFQQTQTLIFHWSGPLLDRPKSVMGPKGRVMLEDATDKWVWR